MLSPEIIRQVKKLGPVWWISEVLSHDFVRYNLPYPNPKEEFAEFWQCWRCKKCGYIRYFRFERTYGVYLTKGHKFNSELTGGLNYPHTCQKNRYEQGSQIAC